MKPTLFVVKTGDPTSDAEFVYRTVCWDRGTNDFDAVIQTLVRGHSIHLGHDQMVIVGGRKSIATAFGHIPVQNYKFENAAGGQLFMTSSRSAPARGMVVDKLLTDAGNFFLGPVTHAVTAFERAEKAEHRAQNTGVTNRGDNYSGRGPTIVAGVAPPLPPPAPTQHRAAGSSIARNYQLLMNGTYNPKVIVKKIAVYEEGLKEKTVVRIIPSAAGFAGVKLGPSASGSVISLTLRAHFNI